MFMKRGRKIMTRALCAILMLCTVIASAAGCKSGTPSYFAFREQDFRAEIEGVMGDVAFSASVASEISETGEGATWRVSYTSPSYLAGLTVEAFPDGSARLSDGETETRSTKDALSGLLSPISSLFWGEEIATVRKDGKTMILGFADGSELSLSEDGVPVAFCSVKMTYEVRKWSGKNI